MIFILTLLWFSPPARAAELPGLTGYFEQKISGFESQVSAPTAGGDIILTDVNVQVSPTVTFGLNDVLGLSISPELDLVFTPPPEDAR